MIGMYLEGNYSSLVSIRKKKREGWGHLIPSEGVLPMAQRFCTRSYLSNIPPRHFVTFNIQAIVLLMTKRAQL